MDIVPEKWVEEYETALAEAWEPALADDERATILRILGWFADLSDEHRAEAIRCLVISAVRACRLFENVLSRADAWIESAQLSSEGD